MLIVLALLASRKKVSATIKMWTKEIYEIIKLYVL